MKFKKVFITTLALISLVGGLTFGPTLLIQANENPYNNINSQTNNRINFLVTVTEDNVEELWHKFFDEAYNHLVLEFTEAGSQAFWDKMNRVATEEVSRMSEEELAEIERELEQRRQEEEDFWANLSPEFLWELYMKEHPEVLEMPIDEKLEIKEAVKASYYDFVRWRPWRIGRAWMTHVFSILNAIWIFFTGNTLFYY